jgi:hypothetical protein
MDHVRLIGRIPESPKSGALEGILRRTLEAREGRWEVRIRHLPHSPWYLLRIRRPSDGFKSTLLLDLYEEPLEQVATTLSDAFKDADGPSARGATAH